MIKASMYNILSHILKPCDDARLLRAALSAKARAGFFETDIRQSRTLAACLGM